MGLASILPVSSETAEYEDEEIRDIAMRSPEEIAQWVQEVAGERGVRVPQRFSESFAVVISRLADAEATLDEVEELLLALRRADVITSRQRSLLQANYLGG